MTLNREQTALFQAQIEQMHPLLLERQITNAPNVIDARDVFFKRMAEALDSVEMPCDCA